MVNLINTKKVQTTSKSINGRVFEVDNWELSQAIIDKVVPAVGVHPFPLNELMLMSGAVKFFRPSVIFEWGTHIGKSARVFFEISKALEVRTEIHSVDLPDEIEHGEHPHNERGRLVKGIKQVKLHQGDGVEVSLSILNQRKNKGKQALFFIDGDHSYESVKRELSTIMEAVPSAVVLLHDTFYQVASSDYNVGPYLAIRDCLKKHKNSYKRIDTATGLPGMSLLYPY